MKTFIGLAFSLSIVATTTACGPSLGEYVGKSATYKSTISTTAAVAVNIEPNDVMASRRGTLGTIGSIVNTASSIGAVAVSADQEKRLHKIIDSTVMAQNVALGFDNGFTDATHLQVVPDSTNPDIRIMLNIRSYGIWAESLMSPMNFFVEADLKLVYTPEMKTVYSTGVSIMREVSSVLSSVAEANVEVSVEVTGNVRPNYNAVAAAHDAARLGAGVANLTAFFKMSDEEVTSAFYYMAVDAGSFIANKLVSAIYR